MVNNRIKLNVFGQVMIVQSKQPGEWEIFLSGNDGKVSPAKIAVPPDIIELDELITYLGDIHHENATLEHPDISILENLG